MYKKSREAYVIYDNHEYSDDLNIEQIKNLKKGQKIMTDMFREFDKMCRENNLEYWCIGGTLLGVVRHKGWIPHDGDIDVCMLEDDYNKFKKLKLRDDLFLQNFVTDPLHKKYGHEYLPKIRHKYSCLTTVSHNKFHHGLQLDIFVMKKDGNKIFTPEKWTSQIDLQYNEVFPLKEGNFEDIKVYIPNNSDKLMTKQYGGDYMKLLDVKNRYPHEGLIDPDNTCKEHAKMYPDMYK
jgi:phosphorylcholine metabolism protein LicD